MEKINLLKDWLMQAYENACTTDEADAYNNVLAKINEIEHKKTSKKINIMTDEQKKKVQNFLNEVKKVVFFEEMGDSVHPCEYYSTEDVEEVANILGIELEDLD